MSDKIWHTDETDNCKIVEELLSAFFDEELNETADAAVRHHLDGCTACATKLQELKATVETINSLPCEATPESDLWPGIVAVTGDRERTRGRFPIPMLLAAVLAGLMIPAALAVGAFTLFTSHSESPRVVADAPVPSAVPTVPAIPTAPEPTVSVDFDSAPTVSVDLDPVVVGGAPRAADASDAGRHGVRSGTTLDALLRSLGDRDEKVRTMAILGLAEVSDPTGEAARAIALTLRADDVPQVRRWAAWALGQIGNGTSVEPLIAALEHDDSDSVRRWAAWSLGMLRDPRASDALDRAVTDDNAEVRRWAVWALAQLGK